MVTTPVIPALRRQSQEDCKFQVSLGYMARPYFKKQKIKKFNGSR
jgi:hypothetical protein